MVQGLVQLREHSHYVQGVAFDPRGEYVVTQSPDRTVRAYAVTGGGRVDSKNIKQVKVIKCVDAPGGEGGAMSMFHDDSMTSFFVGRSGRRMVPSSRFRRECFVVRAPSAR